MQLSCLQLRSTRRTKLFFTTHLYSDLRANASRPKSVHVHAKVCAVHFKIISGDQLSHVYSNEVEIINNAKCDLY